MNPLYRIEPSRPSAFPVAGAGYPFIFALAFTTAVFALLNMRIPALVGLVSTFFVCFFFRDPDRFIPEDENAVVSPADGKVITAERVEHTPFTPGPAQKISIFMTVFHVHVNRMPQEGAVTRLRYYPGKFYAANHEKASMLNEHNALMIETEKGHALCVVQVAGLIARRIICYVQPGDRLTRGQRIGLICFGSRVDVYLPLDTTLSVTVGDHVKAGTSILGYVT